MDPCRKPPCHFKTSVTQQEISILWNQAVFSCTNSLSAKKHKSNLRKKERKRASQNSCLSKAVGAACTVQVTPATKIEVSGKQQQHAGQAGSLARSGKI